jgi:hypothetical protein
LKTGGVAAEMLEASIAYWGRAADAVKFKLHDPTLRTDR